MSTNKAPEAVTAKKRGRPFGTTKNKAREKDNREETLRAAPRGEEKRQRLSKAEQGVQGDFYIPQEMIPAGVDLQWVAIKVAGLPTNGHRVGYEKNGWRAVTTDMFGGRFDGMFMKKGTKGEIHVGGQVLMERPMELTMEARREERQAALQARGMQEKRLLSGQLDGVTLDTQHPTARANTHLTRTVMSGIDVPQDQ